MKIEWLGHSCFLIASDSGLRIITDPYTPGGDLRYGAIDRSADIVTISHDHFDHNNAAAVKGNPQVVQGTTSVKGIDFRAVASYHDGSGGKERGDNTIFCFAVDGIRLCHLGDLGHGLSEDDAARIGVVDVLLVPVGGTYTIDAAAATGVVDALKPCVVVPMHYRNPRCSFPITPVDDFLRGKGNVRRLDGSSVELIADSLPPQTQIVVMEPAL